jgi:CBS domain-containing protein
MIQIVDLIEGKPLIHVQATDNVRDAARTMTEKNIGAVAVLDSGGVLVGLFSERDLMTRVVTPGLDPDGTAVSSVMTRELAIADPEDNIDLCLQKMTAFNCRHLPVVADGSLLGMISLRDLLSVETESTRARASFLNELVIYSPDYET